MKDHIRTEKYLSHFANNRKKFLKRLNDDNFIQNKVEQSFKYLDLAIVKHDCANRDYSPKIKQLVFNTGLIWNYINEKYTSKEEYWLGADTLAFIFTSDSQDLYQLLYRNCRFGLSSEHPWQSWYPAILQIACGNWEGLKQSRDFIDKEIDSSAVFFQGKQMYIDLYDGFLKKDISIIESVLALMESSALKKPRMKSEVYEKYISIFTTALAKLAWMHGMEVEIDSEYVPKELLPFAPLEEYTIPYKFLRDYYREQGIDWRYDPIHPELQDWENDPENPERRRGGWLGKVFGK